MRQVMEMTRKDIESLDKDKTCVCVTIAPIEQHGNHLPLGTDVYEGEKWLLEMVDKLKNDLKEHVFLKLPPLTVAAATASGIDGCIHYQKETTTQVTYEMLDNLIGWGIKYVIIIASHGDPIHHLAIEKACDKIEEKYQVVAFSPMGAFFSADDLHIDLYYPAEVSELLKQVPFDIHGGWIETSSMLDIDKKLVKDCYQTMQDQVIIFDDLRQPNKIKKIMEQGQGYIGSPQLASQKLGKLLNEHTVDYLVRTSKAYLRGDAYESYRHHFLYNYFKE